MIRTLTIAHTVTAGQAGALQSAGDRRVRGLLTGARRRRPAPLERQHLRADLSVDGDQTVVRLVGELDIATAPVLQDLVDTAASRAELRTLVLDLGGVDFMAAAGMNALVHAHRLCGERDASVRLRAVGPQVRRVLAITGMSARYGLCDADGGRC